MAVDSGQTYNATVGSACLTESVNKGTPGILVVYRTDDGDIEDTIWLTPKTADRARGTLTILGADPKQLASWTYLENIGLVVSGHECEITTVDEEYNGKKRVRVQWVNPRKTAGERGALVGRVAHLFGGPKPKDEPKNQEIKDDDIPF